jgi:predicted amidohydrolase
MTERWLDVAVAADLPAADAAAQAGRAGLLVLPARPDLPAEDSDGPLAYAMGELAEARALPLLFAYAEACSGCRHLSLQLVQADGRATANYRATHLSAAARAAGWMPGNWLTLARLEPLTLGLLAGIDPLAPEVARCLAGLGAEVLIALLDREDAAAPPDLLAPLARLRALENGVPVCLVAPTGEVHAADARGRPIPAARDGGLRRLRLAADPAAPSAPRRPDLYRQLVAAAPG